jgi:endogenous inhibitor of DNA gyrase (YacG/DUF329 family)
MSDEINIPVQLPLDDDGFLRRQCPSCEQQFKWFSSSGDEGESETHHQFFCPLCGRPSGSESWYTTEQADYMQEISAPEIDRHIQDMVGDAFKGIKGFNFRANSDFTTQTSVPEPLIEVNDMIIVEPPCHPLEPLKIPSAHLSLVRCLICGSAFST